MDGSRVAQRGQAPERNILRQVPRSERAAPQVLWCPLVEREFRRMGDILGALNYLGGCAPVGDVAWVLGCSERTVRTGAARARNLGLLERRTPCASLRFSLHGRSWWASVPKTAVLRDEYLKFTPAQVRALELAVRGLQSGQRGLAKRARVSRSTVERAFGRAGVQVVPGSWTFRGLTEDGYKIWWKRLQSFIYRSSVALLLSLGSFEATTTPSTHPYPQGDAQTPRVTHADRANPPPEGRISPTAAPLPRRTWRPYGSGKGRDSGLSDSLGAVSWL